MTIFERQSVRAPGGDENGGTGSMMAASTLGGFRSRGWQAGLTFTLLIAGIVAVVGVMTRTAEHRAAAAVAEQQLRRVPAVAALVMKTRATLVAAMDDSTASDIAAAAGVDVVLVDTASRGEPRILGSSVRRGVALSAMLTQWRNASAESAPVLLHADGGGVAAYAESFPLSGRDGRVAARLVAMTPIATPWFGGTAIVAAAAAAGLVALILALFAERRLNRRWNRAIVEMTAAARDAARGQPRAGISLGAGGPVSDLGAAVAALIDRVATSPTLSDDDLAAVAITDHWPLATRATAGGEADGSGLSAGRLFADRYEIIELLGRSDVRTAYKVRDRELGELVLLKTLGHDAFAGDSGSVAQFKADLRVVRRLAHRNILRTYDFGEWSVYYVTMELFDAIPLYDLLKQRGRLSVAETMAIGTQSSRALAVAHGEGVLHRDIRPQSLLLDSHGLLKIADFGLAATAQRIRAAAHTEASADVLAYVPPEVLRAETVDARSDLYSLAVVLYQCLAGRPPIGSPGARERSGSIEPLSSIDPAVPQSFSDLIARSLSSRPEMRPPDAETFRQMLTVEPAAAQ